ncbi:hypothetical protein [Stenotrophomonas sp. SrG]|uniref:hypothetical protein n=1 Tax=Stenotrophomonas sp. SrG TaxID=3414430 RepID=UPI003CEB60D3
MECIYNCAAQTAGIDWPAWVQAVGSVVAIFSAIGIAAWERHSSREDLAERARAERVARYVRANRILGRFQKLIFESAQAFNDGSDSVGNVAIGRLATPQEVRELEQEFHLMPDAGGNAFTAINSFEDAQDLISHGVLSRRDRDEFARQIDHAATSCSMALSAIRAFLGSSDN